MTTEPFAQFDQHGVLVRIREGMTVYDRQNRAVGTVKQVYMGNTNEEARARGVAPATAPRPDDRDDTLVGDFIETFVGQEGLPEAVRQRLLRRGYIQIDGGGLFAADRFATPDEIARVDGGGVLLRVAHDELIEA